MGIPRCAFMQGARSRFFDSRCARTTVFGFTAALVERIPIIGLIFSVSNRIGAAMWAHGTHRDSVAVQEEIAQSVTFQISRRGSTTLQR